MAKSSAAAAEDPGAAVAGLCWEAAPSLGWKLISNAPPPRSLLVLAGGGAEGNLGSIWGEEGGGGHSVLRMDGGEKQFYQQIGQQAVLCAHLVSGRPCPISCQRPFGFITLQHAHIHYGAGLPEGNTFENGQAAAAVDRLAPLPRGANWAGWQDEEQQQQELMSRGVFLRVSRYERLGCSQGKGGRR